MPHQSSRGIDVSKEEERYLRSAFRRFAVPYLFVFAVLAWATTAAMSKETGPGADLSSVRESVAALEQSVTALSARMDKVGADVERAGSRVGALETRKPSRETAASGDTAALERALRDANRRIAELERRSGSGATAAERIDALSARMQRIEAIARSAPPASPASPAPAPTPAPAPAAPAPTP